MQLYGILLYPLACYCDFASISNKYTRSFALIRIDWLSMLAVYIFATFHCPLSGTQKASRILHLSKGYECYQNKSAQPLRASRFSRPLGASKWAS